MSAKTTKAAKTGPTRPKSRQKPRARAKPRGSSRKSADGGHSERAPISALVPDAHNRRGRGERARAMLADSIREVGFGRSIVIDEDGEIMAGNGITKAAAAVGAVEFGAGSADAVETDRQEVG